MTEQLAGKVVGVSGERSPVRLAVEAALTKAGANLVRLPAAVSADVLRRTLGALSAVDGWVHCPEFAAGLRSTGDDSHSFGEAVGTGLEEAHRIIHAVGQLMRKRHAGAIVVITEVSAFAVPHGGVTRATAAAALLQLTRALGVAWARDGVRVNAVARGAIDDSGPGEGRQAHRLRTPLGRLGKAREVADAVMFLLSDDASFITAECLPVDGGWLAYQYFYPAVHPGGAASGPDPVPDGGQSGGADGE